MGEYIVELVITLLVLGVTTISCLAIRESYVTSRFALERGYVEAQAYGGGSNLWVKGEQK